MRQTFWLTSLHFLVFLTTFQHIGLIPLLPKARKILILNFTIFHNFRGPQCTLFNAPKSRYNKMLNKLRTDLLSHGNDAPYTKLGNVDEVGQVGSVPWHVLVHLYLK